jgi:ribokinase
MPPEPPIIAVIGDVNVDLSFAVPSFPAEGDDVSATALAWLSGGTGLNIAVGLAHLGARVRLLARVGSDPTAALALDSARTAGVDLCFIQHDEHFVTGLCTAIVSEVGERTFVCFRGANVHLEDDTLSEVLAGCSLLTISAYALLERKQRRTTLRAIEMAGRNGVTIALDLCLPAIRAHHDEIKALLPTLWLITLNEPEAHLFLPRIENAHLIDHLLTHGANCVALKRGSRGCTLARGSDRIDALPPAVPVVDTTGCGDAFTAALVWGLLHNADLASCAALANICGALTATHVGGVAAIPDRQAIKAQLSTSLHHVLLDYA